MAIDYKAIGRRIRQRRQALNLTQAELAERAGIDATYLSQLERGARKKKMSLDVLGQLAGVLKARPGTLLDGDAPAKDDPLLAELRDILAELEAKKRKEILKALRVLAEW
jgi:transcriptional regulator with XRE-family HTH domain